MSTTALIVAAGSGTRARGDNVLIPKQYLPLGGQPMLTRAISAFAAHPGVTDVLVVIRGDDSGLYDRATTGFAERLRPPVIGGERRQDSVRAGLEALAAGVTPRCVLIQPALPLPSGAGESVQGRD